MLLAKGAKLRARNLLQVVIFALTVYKMVVKRKLHRNCEQKGGNKTVDKFSTESDGTGVTDVIFIHRMSHIKRCTEFSSGVSHVVAIFIFGAE